MKKTLAAVAVLGAFAGSAVAADVTLYGLVDYSLNYQHLDSDVPTQDATDSTQLRSGANSGSRFGLKGTEDLGNGVKVGFVLENGFVADTGALGDKDNRLFDRESQLFVEGSFGRVAFGRFDQLASSLGSYGLLGVTGPFSTGWADATGGLKFVSANGFGKYDNAVTYVTPSFGGLTVYAQYTTKKNDKAAGVENESSADRAYGIGAKFVGAGLTLVGVVDSTNYATWPSTAANQAIDDGLTVTIGGNYDFQVAKVYFGGQYFKNAKKVGAKYAGVGKFEDGYDATDYNGADGFGLGLGVGVPAFGGTAAAYLGYMDADSVDNDVNGNDASVKRYTATVGYSYSFSKRTSMYTSLGYTKDKVERKTLQDVEPSSVEFLLGMIHKF